MSGMEVMPAASEQENRQLKIWETPTFQSRVPILLNGDEQDLLHLALTVDPLRGEPSPVNDAILIFGPYCSCHIYYSVDESLGLIILLDITKDGPLPPPTEEEKNQVNGWVRAAIGAGIMTAVKKGVSWAWDFLKDHHDWLK